MKAKILVDFQICTSVLLMSYSPSPHRSNFVIDFSCSVRINESILMSLFIRHLQRLLKFWQRIKKYVVDSDSKLQDQSGFMVEFMFSKMTYT